MWVRTSLSQILPTHTAASQRWTQVEVPDVVTSHPQASKLIFDAFNSLKLLRIYRQQAFQEKNHFQRRAQACRRTGFNYVHFVQQVVRMREKIHRILGHLKRAEKVFEEVCVVIHSSGYYPVRPRRNSDIMIPFVLQIEGGRSYSRSCELSLLVTPLQL